MKSILDHVLHHAKRHGKTVHKHIRKHHKKYIFGAISGALVYKTLALVLTTAVITPMGYTFASGDINTGTVNTGTTYTGVVLAGDFLINNDDSSTTGLNVILNNNIQGATHMRFGNTESDRNIAAWDIYSTTENRLLDDVGTGTKIVYAQFSGNNTSGDSIILDLQESIEYIPVTNTGTVNTGTTNTGTVNTGTTNTGTVNTGTTNTGTVNTGTTNTGTVNTGTTNTGTVNTGTTNTGTVNTGTTNTGTVNTGTQSSSNQICDAQDIEVLNPLSGDVLKGEFDIIREYKNTDCSSDTMTVKLRDANTQYISLGTVNYSDSNNSGLTFDSSMLYSGFYNIYSGVDLSGNNILIYTGQYTGLNTMYFSGHKIVLVNSSDDIMYEGNEFIIDNQIPELSNITLSVTGYEQINSKKYLGLNGTIDIEFDASEELSGIKLNILGVDAIQESSNNNHYKYTLDFSSNNTQGAIIYNIEFDDIAGNTGYMEGNDANIIFDIVSPTLSNISFVNTGDTIDISINTNEASKIKFVYTLSGSTTNNIVEDNYSMSHNLSLTGVATQSDYNYTLSLTDYTDNTTYIGGVFSISGDTVDSANNGINSEDMIVDAGFSTGADQSTNTGSADTGSVAKSATTFLGEINKFKMCKDTILNISILEIPVRKYKARIEMPELETNYVRKLVSAFSIVLFDRIEKGGLSEAEINDITKEFNNFLVILKLVRDDQNECEQNLSNYYMSKFRDSLVEYNLVE